MKPISAPPGTKSDRQGVGSVDGKMVMRRLRARQGSYSKEPESPLRIRFFRRVQIWKTN